MAPAVVEAGQAITEAAPRVPRLTPRSPSFDSTPPAVVADVARISGAWSLLGGLLADLGALMPGESRSPAALALLVASPEFTSEADVFAFVAAAEGRRDGAVGGLAPALPGQSAEDRRRGEVIPAVALAHLPFVTLGLPSSREEYAARVRAFDEARQPGRWRPIVQQTPSESWMPNLPAAAEESPSSAGLVL